MKYMLMIGSPIEGFKYYGPYDTFDEAEADKNEDGLDWWVVELRPPTPELTPELHEFKFVVSIKAPTLALALDELVKRAEAEEGEDDLFECKIERDSIFYDGAAYASIEFPPIMPGEEKGVTVFGPFFTAKAARDYAEDSDTESYWAEIRKPVYD